MHTLHSEHSAVNIYIKNTHICMYMQKHRERLKKYEIKTCSSVLCPCGLSEINFMKLVRPKEHYFLREICFQC